MGEQVAARLKKKTAEVFLLKNIFHIDTDMSEWTGDEHPACDEGYVNPISREVLFG